MANLSSTIPYDGNIIVTTANEKGLLDCSPASPKFVKHQVLLNSLTNWMTIIYLRRKTKNCLNKTKIFFAFPKFIFSPVAVDNLPDTL